MSWVGPSRYRNSSTSSHPRGSSWGATSRNPFHPAFLSSDLASGITGEIVYVDAGFNIVGMALDSE